jgi:hypothetical protein
MRSVRKGNMNTIKGKKIIAREGLIIIAVLMIFGAILGLMYRENENKQHFEKSAKIAAIAQAYIDPDKPPNSDGKIFLPTGIHIMVQKPTDLIRMQESLKKDFPNFRDPAFVELENQDKSVSIRHYYDSNGFRVEFTDYRTAAVLVLLIYPVYWIVRFVVWSIRTLRQ